MKFPNFNYKGQVFDLSHLVPFYCEYIRFTLFVLYFYG